MLPLYKIRKASNGVALDGFREHPSHLSQTAVARAAILTRAGMLFRQQFKQGLVKPEFTKEGPVCMDSWR